MVKRAALLIILAGIAFFVWENRHQFAGLAGLESNQIRIAGDWYRLRSTVKEADVYTFYDKIIEKNGETHGQYHFTKNEVVQITMAGNTQTYTIEFPEPDRMTWYQEIKGELKPVIRWAR